MTKPGTSLPVRLANFAGAVFPRHDLSLTRTDILACLVIGEAAAGMLHFVSRSGSSPICCWGRPGPPSSPHLWVRWE